LGFLEWAKSAFLFKGHELPFALVEGKNFQSLSQFPLSQTFSTLRYLQITSLFFLLAQDPIGRGSQNEKVRNGQY
jgi:hypothetical protein